MQGIGYWFERIPLSILGGLGVFLLVSQTGFLLAAVLFAVLPAMTAGGPSSYIIAVPTIAEVLAAGVGGVFAGWLAKENGARLGLVIPAIIVLFSILNMAVQAISFWQTTGDLRGYLFSFGEGSVAILNLVSWLLMLVAGWLGGIFGESLTKGDNEGVSLL
ncbi:MAG: hypothetical protein IBX64_04340 [Actinobacteria bacterium]|nr:hypothetical protein [Actinomycetota bacterium]